MKKTKEIISKFLTGSLLLYGFNLLIMPLNIIIPINIVTVLLVCILGIPSIILMIFTLLFVL